MNHTDEAAQSHTHAATCGDESVKPLSILPPPQAGINCLVSLENIIRNKDRNSYERPGVIKIKS